ncbi:MAG: hypothetical protein P8Y23_11215 [Candidatus Lokiarchaeota archaeon]
MPCIFENAKFSSETHKINKFVKNVDEFIEIYSVTSEDYWRKYRSLIKSFNRKYIGNDVKKLHNTLRKAVKKLDGKIKILFELCKRTNFGLSNLIMINFIGVNY